MFAHAEDSFLFLGGVIAAAVAVSVAVRAFIQSRQRP